MNGLSRIRRVIVPLQEISRVFAASDELFDLGRAGTLQDLVRVQHQDPPATRVLDGAIASGREIDYCEIERDHSAP